VRRIALPLLAIGLALGCFLPAAADAVLITINFSFVGNDPVNLGQMVSGSFSFDSSLIPAGEGSLLDRSGLGAASLSMTLDGHTWTTSDADLIWLRSNPAEPFEFGLENWEIASIPYNSLYEASATPAFWIIGDALYQTPEQPIAHGDLEYRYTVFGSNPTGQLYGRSSAGTWSASVGPRPAAEPGTLLLLGVGLLPMGLMRRRKRWMQVPTEGA